MAMDGSKFCQIFQVCLSNLLPSHHDAFAQNWSALKVLKQFFGRLAQEIGLDKLVLPADQGKASFQLESF